MKTDYLIVGSGLSALVFGALMAKAGKTVRVLEAHQSDDIIKALKRIPLAIREQVEEVCVDMWGGFPKVIRAIFPNAKIVIDRFHVQKLINKNLNKIRLKLELRGLKNKNLIMTAQARSISYNRRSISC
jgi:transposase